MNKLVIPPSPNWYCSNGLACAPDNTVIYGARNDLVILETDALDPEKEAGVHIISKAHSQKVVSVNVNKLWGRPRKLAVTSAEDNVVKVWDIQERKRIYSHLGHGSPANGKVIGAAFSSDERIVSASDSGQIIVSNISLNQDTIIKNVFGCKVNLSCLSVCPHTNYLVAFGLKNGLIFVVDIRKSGRVALKIRAHDKDVISLAWCPVPINIFPVKPGNVVSTKHYKPITPQESPEQISEKSPEKTLETTPKEHSPTDKESGEQLSEKTPEKTIETSFEEHKQHSPTKKESGEQVSEIISEKSTEIISKEHSPNEKEFSEQICEKTPEKPGETVSKEPTPECSKVGLFQHMVETKQIDVQYENTPLRNKDHPLRDVYEKSEVFEKIKNISMEKRDDNDKEAPQDQPKTDLPLEKCEKISKVVQKETQEESHLDTEKSPQPSTSCDLQKKLEDESTQKELPEHKVEEKPTTSLESLESQENKDKVPKTDIKSDETITNVRQKPKRSTKNKDKASKHKIKFQKSEPEKEITRDSQPENEVVKKPDPVYEEARYECLLASAGRDNHIYIWRAGSDGRMQTFFKINNKKGQNDWNAVWWPTPRNLLTNNRFADLVQYTLPLPAVCDNISVRPGELMQEGHSCLLFNIAGPLIIRDQNDWEDEVKTNAWTVCIDRVITNTALYPTPNRTLNSLPTFGSAINKFALSPIDPNRLAIGTAEGVIKIWNLFLDHTNNVEMTKMFQKIRGKITTLAWHPNLEGMLAFGTNEGRVGLIDAVNKFKAPEFYPQLFRNEIYKAEWGPIEGNEDNMGLYVVSEGKLAVHSAEKNKKASTFPPPVEIDVPENTFVYSFSWKPDYTKLLLCTKSGILYVYSKKLNIICTNYLNKRLYSINWHPEAQSSDPKMFRHCNFFIGILKGKEIALFKLLEDGKNVETVWEFKSKGGIITDSAWSSHNPKQFVIATEDGIAEILDIKKRTVISTYIYPHFEALTAIIWSPIEENFIITGTKDYVITIWNKLENSPKSEEEISTLRKAKLKEITKESKDLVVKSEELDKSPVPEKPKKNKGSMFPKTYNQDKCIARDIRRIIRHNSGVEIDGKIGCFEQIDVLNVFGAKKALDRFMRINQKCLLERGKFQQESMLQLFKGDILNAVQEAIAFKRVTPWIISVAPMASHNLWCEAVDTYIEQLRFSANTDVFELATFLLTRHRTDEAVNVLCEEECFTEAFALARMRYPADDERIKTVLEKWAEKANYYGNFELVACCYTYLGRYDDAAKVLYRRENKDPLEACLLLAKKSGNQELYKIVMTRLGKEVPVTCDKYFQDRNAQIKATENGQTPEENGQVTEESEQISDENDQVSKESGQIAQESIQKSNEAVISEEKTQIPEEKAEILQEKPQKLEEKLQTPEKSTLTSEEKPKTPEEKAQTPEKKLQTPEEKSQVPKDKPRTPEEKLQIPEGKPQAYEEKPERPKEKRETPEEKPKTPEEKPHKSEEKAPESEEKHQTPEKKPQTPERKSQTPEEKPQMPKDKVFHQTPEEKPEIPQEKPKTPEEKPQKLEEKHQTPEEKAPTSEEIHQTPVKKAQTPEKVPQTPEEKPQVHKDKSQVPEDKPQTPEEKSQVLKEKPQTPEEKSEILQEKTQISEKKPQKLEEQLKISEEKPQIPEKMPQTPDRIPQVSKDVKPQVTKQQTLEEKSETPKEKPHTPGEKLKMLKDKPQTPEEKAQMPKDKPQTSQEKPKTTEKMPQTPERKTQTTEEKPQTFEEKPQMPKDKPQTPEGKRETPKEKPHTPGEKLQMLKDKPETPEEKPQVSKDKPHAPEIKPQTPEEKLKMAIEKAQLYEEKSQTPEKKPQTQISAYESISHKAEEKTPQKSKEKPEASDEKPQKPKEKPQIAEKPELSEESVKKIKEIVKKFEEKAQALEVKAQDSDEKKTGVSKEEKSEKNVKERRRSTEEQKGDRKTPRKGRKGRK